MKKVLFIIPGDMKKVQEFLDAFNKEGDVVFINDEAKIFQINDGEITQVYPAPIHYKIGELEYDSGMGRVLKDRTVIEETRKESLTDLIPKKQDEPPLAPAENKAKKQKKRGTKKGKKRGPYKKKEPQSIPKKDNRYGKGRRGNQWHRKSALTNEGLDFLRKNAPNMGNLELTKKFNDRFKKTVSTETIKFWKNKNKIKGCGKGRSLGVKSNKHVGSPKKFTPEVIKTIKECIDQGMNSIETKTELEKKYSKNFPLHSVRTAANKNGIKFSGASKMKLDDDVREIIEKYKDEPGIEIQDKIIELLQKNISLKDIRAYLGEEYVGNQNDPHKKQREDQIAEIIKNRTGIVESRSKIIKDIEKATGTKLSIKDYERIKLEHDIGTQDLIDEEEDFGL